MNTSLKNLPKGLEIGQWSTEEKDLPSGPTNDVFLVRAIDVKTKEIIHSFAMFVYWPVREPIDFDEWRFICGATCFARESVDNKYKVMAWTKVKLV
jgi:hypothetical protein